MDGWDYTCVSLPDTKTYTGVCSKNENHKYEGSVKPRSKKCTASKCKGEMTYTLRKEPKEITLTELQNKKRYRKRNKKSAKSTK